MCQDQTKSIFEDPAIAAECQKIKRLSERRQLRVLMIKELKEKFKGVDNNNGHNGHTENDIN